MTDDVRERGCEEYGDELAELALGVLTGRDRARVLSHVESCPRCAEELEDLSRTADSVVQAAPEMEPPLGCPVQAESCKARPTIQAARRGGPRLRNLPTLLGSRDVRTRRMSDSQTQSTHGSSPTQGCGRVSARDRAFAGRAAAVWRSCRQGTSKSVG